MRRRTKGGVRPEARGKTGAAVPETPRQATPPQPQTDEEHPAWRSRRKSPVFKGALAFSLLFHLSMVTVFNIVIFFPREDLRYYNFRIVQTASSTPRPGVPASTTAADRLRGPSLKDRLDEGLALEAEGAGLDAELPEIELPTLEFAELSRLRVRQQRLDDPELLNRLLHDEPQDSWSRFGRGLRRFGESITGLPEPPRPGAGEKAAPSAPARPKHTPAQGFEAHIEWDQPGNTRRLLFAPPLEPLWDIAPAELEGGIELVLTVSPHGRVVNVWSPEIGRGDLLADIQAGVLKYRFEPLEQEDARNQMATLHIVPGEDGL